MKKALLLLVAFTYLGLAGCAAMIAPNEEEIRTAYYGPYPSNYEQIVKDAFAQSLFDPYSAQYSFDGSPQQRYLTQSPLMGGGTEFGWGGTVLLNAKNRYGAYVGGQRYIYLIRDGRVIKLENAGGVLAR